MQWSAARHGGFTKGEPWIKVNPNYSEINVEADLERPDSVYRYYQRLIALRKDHDLVVDGAYIDHDYPSDHLYVFERRLSVNRWLIIANVSTITAEYRSSLTPNAHVNSRDYSFVLGNYLDPILILKPDEGSDESSDGFIINMRPYEVIILNLGEISQ
jgi:oligo-1,6-glucosidase